MTAIVRNNFRIYNARKFIESLNAVNSVYTNSLYIGVARPQTWNVDGTPDAPGNNIKDELTDWADLMFMKRIYSSNICHAIPKRIWAANTLYDVYRHDWNGYSTAPSNNSLTSAITQEKPTDLSKVKCYCTSPNNIVYLCLGVPKDVTGAPMPSLINPDNGTTTVPGTTFTTSSLTGIVYCSDGYTWLKIANSVDLISQFDTIDYYPIQTVGEVPIGVASATQQTWQTNGASYLGGIYNILVVTGGSGYLGGVSGSFKISNAATGTVALDATQHVAVIGDGEGLEYVVQYKSGALDKIIVTNPGRGYTWAKVIVHDAGGSGASAVACLTPLSGLTVDPVKTLNGYYLIVQGILYDDENIGDSALNHGTDFTIDNDYRKVVLVSNPKKFGAIASANKLDLTYGLTNSSIGAASIPSDTVLTSGTTTVRVVDSGITSYNNPIVRVIQVAPNSNEVATQNNNVTLGTYTYSGGSFAPDTIHEPDADIGSGDIIYADYRRPVSRARKQSEEYKIILLY